MPPTQMSAAVLYGKEDLRIETVPVEKPGKGELLLKIEAALTCGTDLKVFRRGYHAAMLKPPCLFGHECAGIVAESGVEERKFKIGDRVVVANSAPCDECYFCKKGQQNLCEDLQFLNGAYAEYLKIPSRFVQKNAYPIPEGLSFSEAAMTEPLACVVHGVDETAPQKGDTAAVIGLGPIGLMFVAVLKNRGLKVIGVGRHGPRLEAARRLGADEVIESVEGDDLKEKLKSYRFDVVIEATGKPEIWEQAVGLVRRGGLVNLFGGPPAGTKVTLETNRLHYDQITIKSSFHHKPSSIQTALNLIAKKIVPADLFITDQRKLKDLPNLFREMVETKRVVKTCILP
jgi:L-iditol 2-dehydrogenase